MPRTRQSDPLLTQTASEKFNLIDLIPMYDGGESLGIRRFLEKINDVANLGKWSNAEKVTILKLKLAGIAEEFFYPTQPTLFSSCIQGSSESVQEFAARINKLGTQIFHSSNTAQNTEARNANDQLLQSRFISGLRNDIRRFVLARDPNNLEESINAALIEEQNVKLNQIANDERTGLSPLQTETSVISALTNKLEEINLRVERLQEASSVTARKTERERAEERKTNYQPPWGNAAGEFSVSRQPNTHSFDQRRVHFHDSAFRDNYTAPGIRQTVRKELPVEEEIQLVSDAIREMQDITDNYCAILGYDFLKLWNAVLDMGNNRLLIKKISEATYTSPFFLEHVRDIRLSYTYEKNSNTPQNKYEYVEKLLPSLEQIFNKVLKNLKEQEASHVDLSTRATKQHHYDYKIGSLCFIKTPNIKSNLSPKLRPKLEDIEFDNWFENVEDHPGNRDYTGMWVRRGSTNLMAGKVVFLRGLLSPNRVVDLTVMNPLRILFEVVRSALKARTCHYSRHFPSYVCQKKPPVWKRTRCPGHPFVHSFPLR
ncbi:integrase catalytic domain-containing protein [Trichonephila clavipes]|nr:integrase catalytic domain-containing protein [Trichonephila clavipes]